MGTERMAGGRVAQIRLKPLDCISVVDFVRQRNVDTQYMSFNSVVHTAITMMIAEYIQNGMLQEPDGFTFAEKMEQFYGGKSTKAKRAQTAAQWENEKRGISSLSSTSNWRPTPQMLEVSEEQKRMTEEYRKNPPNFTSKVVQADGIKTHVKSIEEIKISNRRHELNNKYDAGLCTPEEIEELQKLES